METAGGTPLKIALAGDSLAGGGAEKVQAWLSVFLSSHGHQVHHLLFSDRISYPYQGKVSVFPSSGSKIGNLWRAFRLWRTHRQEKFDYLIDFRVKPSYFHEDLFVRMSGNCRLIYTVHSGRLDWYLPGHATQARKVYDRLFEVVAVSRNMASELRKRLGREVVTIHNPVQYQPGDYQDPVGSPYILAVGRMNDWVKQFDKAIDAFVKSGVGAKGIILVILGEGKHRKELEAYARKSGAQQWIRFEGHRDDPHPYYANALFTLLSSRTEGFPNVLVESLSHHTPVVSFDCFSGPSEIIRNNVNGILVPDQDVSALASAIKKMVSDDAFRLACQENASAGLEELNPEQIGEQWLELLGQSSKTTST